jgi:membrane-associated phospholipid phosphatase
MLNIIFLDLIVEVKMHSAQIIIFLQKIQNPILNTIMNYITLIGYEMGVTIILCIYLFGFSFHKGFFVLQSSFLTFVSTDILKNGFMLKRPFLMDNNVLNLDKSMIKEASLGSVSYSFPSGHSSGITVVFGSISLSVKKRWFYTLSAILIFLVCFSRIYLGVHYLQDVLVGISLGIINILLYYIPLKNYIQNNKNFPFNLTLTNRGRISYFIFFIFLPFLLIFIPIQFDKGQVGFLIGANLGYFLLGRNLKNSYLEYKIKIVPVILRIIIGFAFYMILRLGLSFLFNLIFPDKLIEIVYFRVIRYFLVGLFTVGLSIICFLKMKLAYTIE